MMCRSKQLRSRSTNQTYSNRAVIKYCTQFSSERGLGVDKNSNIYPNQSFLFTWINELLKEFGSRLVKRNQARTSLLRFPRASSLTPTTQ